MCITHKSFIITFFFEIESLCYVYNDRKLLFCSASFFPSIVRLFGFIFIFLFFSMYVAFVLIVLHKRLPFFSSYIHLTLIIVISIYDDSRSISSMLLFSWLWLCYMRCVLLFFIIIFYIPSIVWFFLIIIEQNGKIEI